MYRCNDTGTIKWSLNWKLRTFNIFFLIVIIEKLRKMRKFIDYSFLIACFIYYVCCNGVQWPGYWNEDSCEGSDEIRSIKIVIKKKIGKECCSGILNNFENWITFYYFLLVECEKYFFFHYFQSLFSRSILPNEKIR